MARPERLRNAAERSTRARLTRAPLTRTRLRVTTYGRVFVAEVADVDQPAALPCRSPSWSMATRNGMRLPEQCGDNLRAPHGVP
jgi:hypothetical protein